MRSKDDDNDRNDPNFSGHAIFPLRRLLKIRRCSTPVFRFSLKTINESVVGLTVLKLREEFVHFQVELGPHAI